MVMLNSPLKLNSLHCRAAKLLPQDKSQSIDKTIEHLAFYHTKIARIRQDITTYTTFLLSKGNNRTIRYATIVIFLSHVMHAQLQKCKTD